MSQVQRPLGTEGARQPHRQQRLESSHPAGRADQLPPALLLSPASLVRTSLRMFKTAPPCENKKIGVPQIHDGTHTISFGLEMRSVLRSYCCGVFRDVRVAPQSTQRKKGWKGVTNASLLGSHTVKMSKKTWMRCRSLRCSYTTRYLRSHRHLQ